MSKYVMIVTDNCPRCANSKKVLEDNGLLDQVEIVPITNPQGMEYAKEYKLTVAGADIISIESKSKMSVSDFVDMIKEAQQHAETQSE